MLFRGMCWDRRQILLLMLSKFRRIKIYSSVKYKKGRFSDNITGNEKLMGSCQICCMEKRFDQKFRFQGESPRSYVKKAGVKILYSLLQNTKM